MTRPSKPQRLWSIDAAKTTWTCDLRLLGPGAGWGVEIFRGSFKFTEHRQELREDALKWAVEMRKRFPAENHAPTDGGTDRRV